MRAIRNTVIRKLNARVIPAIFGDVSIYNVAQRVQGIRWRCLIGLKYWFKIFRIDLINIDQ